MRYGVCTSLDSASTLASIGFDYIELSVQRDLIPEAPDADWADLRSRIDASPLRPEAFNLFVPGHLKIVGPSVDSAALGRYVEAALSRAAQVGGAVVVLGSGGARGVPESFPAERAERQLALFLHQCADAAERFGVTVALEPLGRECSLIRSVAEGAALVRTVDRAGVRNLADTWHMLAIEEPLSEIVASADVLSHVHTAGAGRRSPDITEDFTPLFRALRTAGYDGRVSLECSWEDLASDGETALATLRMGAANAAS